MLTVNLFDSNFPGQSCSVFGQTSERIAYVRNHMAWDGITVFTDGQMFGPAVDAVQSPIKVGWLHEGKALHPENYDNIHEVAGYFDEVWTYDQNLLDADPQKFKLTIRGGSWLPAGLWGIPAKTTHAAMILSDKVQLPGHALRHAVANAELEGLDFYGPSYHPIGTDKALAYMTPEYAVVIEAVKERNFFSEHLIDALALGCVVFYWGCPNIGQYLNDEVIIPFATISELRWLLTSRGTQEYRHLLPALMRMQRHLPVYRITEDWQAEHRYPALVSRLSRAVPA